MRNKQKPYRPFLMILDFLCDFNKLIEIAYVFADKHFSIQKQV